MGTRKTQDQLFFLKRLAPIQVNFLGYPGTLGSKNYHYIIADRIVIPEKLKKYYSEKNSLFT